MLSDCTAMLCKCTLVYDVIFAIVGSVVQGIKKGTAQVVIYPMQWIWILIYKYVKETLLSVL